MGGEWRSRFDLVRVENAIGLLDEDIGDRGLIWLGWKGAIALLGFEELAIALLSYLPKPLLFTHRCLDLSITRTPVTPKKPSSISPANIGSISFKLFS